MNSDQIQWEILEDGTVRLTTDGIGPANHRSADELLEGLKDALGGPVEIKRRTRLAGLGVPIREASHLHQH